MAQQTALDWFVKEIQTRLDNYGEVNFGELAEEAEAMEKEQIIKAHGTKSNGRLKNDGQFIIGEITGEEYYNETYKQ